MTTAQTSLSLFSLIKTKKKNGNTWAVRESINNDFQQSSGSEHHSRVNLFLFFCPFYKNSVSPSHLNSFNPHCSNTFLTPTCFLCCNSVYGDHTTYRAKLQNAARGTQAENLQSCSVVRFNTSHERLLLVGDTNTYSSSSFFFFSSIWESQ